MCGIVAAVSCCVPPTATDDVDGLTEMDLIFGEVGFASDTFSSPVRDGALGGSAQVMNIPATATSASAKTIRWFRIDVFSGYTACVINTTVRALS